jgi:hypothetical protein
LTEMEKFLEFLSKTYKLKITLKSCLKFKRVNKLTGIIISRLQSILFVIFLTQGQEVKFHEIEIHEIQFFVIFHDVEIPNN